MNRAVISIMGIFIMFSCADKTIEKWDDNIKLSTKNVNFSTETDSITITTEGDKWWINGIRFVERDSTYSYYPGEEINLESDAYSIKVNYFTVEKRDNQTLFVRSEENNTGKERRMSISLQAGNYFDYIRIKQASN